MSNTATRPMYGLSQVFEVAAPLGPPPEVTVPNDWGLIPSGLVTGDKFRLLFLSSTKSQRHVHRASRTTTPSSRTAPRPAMPTSRTTSTGFRVVGCTAAVDARDNTATNTNIDGAGVPIYWLGGNQVADDYADFYDGDWDDEANDKNESGNNGPDTSQTDNFPFTGCNHNGTEAVFSVNSYELGAPAVRIGRPNHSGDGNGPLSSSSGFDKTSRQPMYGLSQVFEVAAQGPPPEVTVPNDWGLIPSGLVTGDKFRLLFLSST